MAISLKKSQLCHVKPPFWLDAGLASPCPQCAACSPVDAAWLRERLQHEKEDDTFYEPLPFHYLEIAAQLLETYITLRVRFKVYRPLAVYHVGGGA